MTTDFTVFTSDQPCRCGYDGVGDHRCHAGRSQPGKRCVNVAVPKLYATNGALAGYQLKYSCVVGYYCDTCHAELAEINRKLGC